MAHHEDINIPKFNKTKTLDKVIVVLIVPLAILAVPLIYGQKIDLETALSAILALGGLFYVTFFIIGRTS